MNALVTRRSGSRPALAAACLLAVLAGCSSPSCRPATAATPPPGASSALRVTSSIPDGAHLEAARPWSASVAPATDVASVDFLVDGAVKWTEKNPPYFFNDDNYLLPPWLLGPGAHALKIVATTSSGATASVTSHITIAAAPRVPGPLLGTFQRTLTQADLDRTSSAPGYDAANHPPTGSWTISFASNYLIALGDPSNPVGENEPFQANAAGDLTLAGPANWLTPADLRGGLCEPSPVDRYHWSVSGNVLTITGGTNCPNRKALFGGEWLRR
jgi:hypothetical protein